MIVGPVDHGKSTLAQILGAYAVRLDRTPIMVDLDLGQGLFSIPSCLAAVPLDKTSLSVEEGFANSTPLVYFHGYNSPKDNIHLYRSLVETLAGKVEGRLQRDLDTKSSGLIVNSCGWIDGEGFELLLHTIRTMSIDVVLVMGHDKLYSNLTSSLGGAAVTVVKLPRSGGVVQRDASTRKRLRKAKIREYFYGRAVATTSLTNTLFSPERRESVPLSSFTFLRVGGIQLSEGMKVFGDSSHQNSFKLAKIAPSQELAYSVVAVLHDLDWEAEGGNAPTAPRAGISAAGEVNQNLLSCNVAGFVSIVQIDLERDVMTLLCPCPGSLPSSYLLVGSIKWME
mmetsp:Transcript_8265/g.18502  ORF Transcript_8265/g.18502 Transcript_8265/m.18502 type:complete len:339 (+) Transcript_8265:519-1535(+)